ncbi:nucleopolyhedrovirus P10 family protein [Streptomyces antibioticus]|uniref:nucleopolyhedrovirus P10 family protein n=1 Tax=Streptomyces antibioticus TaxID=1890 RepID=UPI0036BCA969
MDGWTSAVRNQLGLGRLLPLGGAGDGVWIAESAARTALREAVRGLPGVRLGALRIAAVDSSEAVEPVVPAPPSGLPPGPLRLTADFAAVASGPLPPVAGRVRDALAEAAAERLGLVVTEVDLRVTALLDEDPEPEPAAPAEPVPAGPAPSGAEALAAAAALAVPGVTGLTGVLGRPVRLEEHPAEPAALPRGHARVEIAVTADLRALDVAREVRTAVGAALPDHPTVTVLVTAVG